MLDAPNQGFLNEAHSILADCSKYFNRSVSIEESTLCAAIPNYQHLKGYFHESGILGQSTENQFLFRREDASNFFDYFQTLILLLFEQAVPTFFAKEIASDFTNHLIEIWDESDDHEAYEKLMRSHCHVQGIKLELQNNEGEVGTRMGEILAILCQMAIEQLNPKKPNREWNAPTCHIEPLL